MTFNKNSWNSDWEFGVFGQGMNINYRWLEGISNLRLEFMYYYNCDEPQERCLTKMLRILQILEVEVSPKIDNDIIEDNLVWLEQSIVKAYRRDSDGKIVGWLPKLVFEIEKKLMATYRLLNLEMERKGLLTIQNMKPGAAMGNFKSA